MRAIAAILLLACVSGCATTLRVTGYPDADVYVARYEPGAAPADLVLAGRTAGSGDFSLAYALPRELTNAKVRVRVVTAHAAWEQLVLTDRDVTVRYPPEGTPFDVLKPVEPGPPRISGASPAAAAAPAPPAARPAAGSGLGVEARPRPSEPSVVVMPD